MTSWLISFGWNWLLVPVAIWFLSRLYAVLLNPRIKYVTHSKATGSKYFLTVNRQNRLPPWLNVQETWLVCLYGSDPCCREHDGKAERGIDGIHSFLGDRLIGCLKVAIAREEELERLSK